MSGGAGEAVKSWRIELPRKPDLSSSGKTSFLATAELCPASVHNPRGGLNSPRGRHVHRPTAARRRGVAAMRTAARFSGALEGLRRRADRGGGGTGPLGFD